MILDSGFSLLTSNVCSIGCEARSSGAGGGYRQPGRTDWWHRTLRNAEPRTLKFGPQTLLPNYRGPPGLPDLLTLQPGRVVGLVGSPGFGLTRLGLAMLAAPAITGPIAYLDVRGWFCSACGLGSGDLPGAAGRGAVR